MMTSAKEKSNPACPSDKFAPYLDGELSASEESSLEAHLLVCGSCREDFNLQKRLLSAIAPAVAIPSGLPEMPADFARVVAVRAESSVDGIRSRRERSKAVFATASLLLLAVLALFTEAGGDVFWALERAFVQLVAVLGFILHFVFEVGIGLGVVLRSFGSTIGYGSAGSVFVSVLFFLLSAALLSRVILKDLRS